MKVTDKQYYMDGYLIKNLDHLKEAVKKKWDGLLIFDGMEGSGKTNLTAATSYYLDNNYTLDNVVFTVDQFNMFVDTAKPGSVCHWDEFVFGGLSTEALTAVQNAIIKKMTTIRKKRLFILLVMNYFHMFRPYFSVARSRALINVYSPDGVSRGYFNFYSYRRKKILYYAGKKFLSYRSQKPNFHGRFTDYMSKNLFFDEDAYDRKKEAAILSIGDKVDKWKWRATVLSKALKGKMTQAEIGKLWGVDRSFIAHL